MKPDARLTLVLVGAHGVGKSTLCRALSRRLGLPYDTELGATLRLEALARDAEQHAQRPQEAFDHEVFELEIARDAARGPSVSRIVETWHPGNLAYAEQRSPRLAAAYRARMTEHLCVWKPRVLIVPLTMRDATARARCSEPGDGDDKYRFFLDVGRRAAEVAHELGLVTMSPLATDDDSPEVLARHIVRSLERSALLTAPRAHTRHAVRTRGL